MSFFWYQLTGGTDEWLEGLSEHREEILRSRKPAFMTVLDAHSSPDPGWGREEYSKMKYSGPLYFDWDAESLDDTIPQFQKFIEKLEELDVDTECIRLYATGGRGFHMEIPPEVFMAKVPKTGVAALPYIYKEIAYRLSVDTLDHRVYTGRKGRMWRTIGVQRSNGKYKVPITLLQAKEMTTDLYEELCSVCVTTEIQRAEPSLSTQLSAMFRAAQDKVEKSIKSSAKAKADLALIAKFQGKFPPTIEAIMRGENLAPSAGFHKIAMQLAIVANAMGKTAEQLVEACEGLCKNHSSDSERYGSPRKRKEELRRMWEYTHDNPCYSFSKGGIRSILDPSVSSGDLDGNSTTAGVGTLDDSEPDLENLSDERKRELSEARKSLYGGVSISRSGIHLSVAEGQRDISNIGLSAPTILAEGIGNSRGQIIGVQANVHLDDKPIGRHEFKDKDFLSRNALNARLYGFNGIFNGSDLNASAVRLILTTAAKDEKSMVYAIHREGLDIVEDPSRPTEKVKDILWVHPDKVFVAHDPMGRWDAQEKERMYQFTPLLAANAQYKADVHNAPTLEATEDSLQVIRSLMRSNTPTVVAQMLGWFVSCFHKQFYQDAFSQFPLLHPNGPAGSGKTQTSHLLSRLHYFKTAEKHMSCGVGTTAFPIKAAIAGSASVPLLLDEFKPSEMGDRRTNELLQSFRLAYNQSNGATGGVSSGAATSSYRDIVEVPYSAPICFMAEAQEVQTAIVQRSLPVFFSSQDSGKHTKDFRIAEAGKDTLSHLGKLLLVGSFQESIDSRRLALQPIIDRLRESSDRNVHDRQIFNLAVVLAGLDFLDLQLQKVFGTKLCADVDVLREAVHTHRVEINMATMSEIAKVFNDISLITRTEESDSEYAIREGIEYVVHGSTVDILMRETFVKYFAWATRKGMKPYFQGGDQFISAAMKFGPLLDKTCVSSSLKRNEQARVFRFDISLLAAEGVEAFKTKG